MINWTDAQVSFISWCQYYHNIYSMGKSQRPSNEIIEDDEKLDDFLRQKEFERMKQEKEMERLNKSQGGNVGKPAGKSKMSFSVFDPNG